MRVRQIQVELLDIALMSSQAVGCFRDILSQVFCFDVRVALLLFCLYFPVLTITPFDTEAEAIRIANDTPYDLAAYIQTGNTQRAERASSRLRAGTVHINGATLNYDSFFGWLYTIRKRPGRRNIRP